MYRDKRNDLSEVLEAVVDSGVVHSDQRAIWTTWRVSMEALEEISRRAIGGCSDAGGWEMCRSVL